VLQCRYSGYNDERIAAVMLGLGDSRAAADFPVSLGQNETWSCEYKSGPVLDDWKLKLGEQRVE
jgi:hypothetical protein